MKYPDHIFRILRRFVPEELQEELEGDLRQRYQRDLARHGERSAVRRLFWNTAGMFRPGILFRGTNKRVSSNYTPMFRNYFKMAFRNLMANKSTSFINLLGLTTGITAVIVISFIIRYELSFDTFHTESGRVYRLVRENVVNGVEEFRVGVSYPIPELLKNEVSAFDKITTVNNHQAVQVDVVDEKGGTLRKFREEKGLAFIDPNFFAVFDFGRPEKIWIAGNPATALTDFGSVVLSRSMAKKYFGDEPALGRTIRFDQQLDCKITGVVEDLPLNTDLPFTIFVSYATMTGVIVDEETMTNNYGSVAGSNQVFVTVRPGANIEDLEAQIHRVHLSRAPEVAVNRFYKLQPVTEMHHDKRFENFNARIASFDELWTLAIAGLILLALVCVNYINLATAQSTLRAKEIGVRKIIGSNRIQLIGQFMSEAFVLNLIAGLTALMLANFAMNNLSSLTNVTMLQPLLLDGVTWAGLLALVITVTLLAGFYPALIVSGLPALEALRIRLTGKIGSGAVVRKTLVAAQFTATQVFVIAAFIAVRQMDYFQHHDLGFDKEAIVTVPLPVEDSLRSASLFNRLRDATALDRVSLSSSTPSGTKRARWYVGISNPGQKDDFVCEYQGIDENFLELFRIPLVAGRNFVHNDPASYLLINETLAKTLGFANHQDAIGREVICNSTRHTIIGVTKDFHVNSLRDGMANIAFERKQDFFLAANIKLGTSDPALFHDQLVAIERAWSSTYPEFVFTYSFLDDNVAAFYAQERKISTLLKIFSGVFLLIACLGLFGLISFVANRRLKEVAIRKVLGAQMLHILSLISRDYLLLIMISFLIAAPISYWIMSNWLMGFEYHTTITWWILVAPGLLVLAVATFAVSGRALKAAQANPVDNLKSE